MRTKYLFHLIAATLSLLMLTCATGIDPPKPSAMVEITGGLDVFVFGSSTPCDTSSPCALAYPVMKVTLRPFAIDRHEVTNIQYRHCVDKGFCTLAEGCNAGYVSDYCDSSQYDNHPVVGVTWEQAKTYCDFAHKRLPTEVEWERAAAGPSADQDQSRSVLEATGWLKRLHGWEYQYATKKSDADCRSGEFKVNMQYCRPNQEPTQALPEKVMTNSDDRVDEEQAASVEKTIFDLTGNVSEWVEDQYSVTVTCKETVLTSHGTPSGCDDFFDCQNNLPCQTSAVCDCQACNPSEFDPEQGGACQLDDNQEKDPSRVKAADVCFRLDCGLKPPVCIPYANEILPSFPPVTGQVDVVVKGGHYTALKGCATRLTYREHYNRLSASPDRGFRCAKDL